MLGLSAAASYTVAPGDTLSGIAVAHGLSTQQIAAHNGIENPDHIVAGSSLELPGSTGGDGGQSASAGGGSHTVQSNEHLSGIAATHGVSTAAVADANGLTNHDLVIAGSTLTIPGGGQSQPEQPSTPPSGSISRSEAGALIERTAAEHGWNPSFVKAIAWQESGWNQGAVSHAGARGIMQVMPDTGTWVGSALAGRPLNLDDPHDNVLAGVLFLDYLHGITGGDTEMLLAGYYQGLRSLEQNGMYDDTRQYIDNVMRLRQRF